MHEIIFRPWRHNLAGESKNAAAGCAVLGRMQHVIVSRASQQTSHRCGQRLIYPGVKNLRGSGSSRRPPMCSSPHSKGKTRRLSSVVPPGVLVAANFCSSQDIIFELSNIGGGREGCQTRELGSGNTKSTKFPSIPSRGLLISSRNGEEVAKNRQAMIHSLLRQSQLGAYGGWSMAKFRIRLKVQALELELMASEKTSHS